MEKNINCNKLINRDNIAEFLNGRSPTLSELVNDNYTSEFILFYKLITPSDLPTFGKRTNKNDGPEKNLLFYLSTKEMEELSKIIFYRNAHQASIYLPSDFYKIISCPDPRDAEKGVEHDKRIKLNDFADVFLVNECIENFNFKNTKTIFQKLNKKWESRGNYRLKDKLDVKINTNSKFTPIEISVSVHGIGVSDDVQFHNLRHFIFKGDTFLILVEKHPYDFKNNQQKPIVYILPIKNPRFYQILNIKDKIFEKFMIDLDRKINAEDKIVSREQKIRMGQKQWRQYLAEESMSITDSNEVICPISFLRADFDKLGVLFVASHIKEYSSCEDDEKYDVNNGLLLSSNIDKLFDAHLFTISPEKELIISSYISQEQQKELHLNHGIIKVFLNNEQRMKYLSYHRNKFKQLERERKEKDK